MGKIAADRTRIRAHRHRLQAHAREGVQIGDEHAVIGPARRGFVDIEAVGILHQEFAAAHDAEARALLVAELPRDLIEVQRQVAVGPHGGAEDVGDHFLGGGAVQQIALMAVLDAQHLLAIVVVTAGFAPQVSQLQGRHQQLHRAGLQHFLFDDALDLAQDAQAQGQPGIDAGGFLADHGAAQHQAVRDDLRLGGVFLEQGQKIARQPHERESVVRQKVRAT